jgi:hypothetical protein
MQRRDLLLVARARAQSLRQVFTNVAELRIELVFSGVVPMPSPQLHTLYPAAPAFFRFVCPCAQCDGDFDLSELVSALVERTAACTQSDVASGQLACQGIQFRDKQGQKGCPMELRYHLTCRPAC